MIILGIETSCDETSAAVVEDGTKILSNIVGSSQELHVKTGGIIPEIASREQIKYIIPVINQALTQAFDKSSPSIPPKPFFGVGRNTSRQATYPLIPNIDAISVTVGPGLIGSLLVGVETAKTLAYLWEKPIIPVNHLTAHLYANWLSLLSLRDHKVAKQSLNLNSKIATSPTAPRNDEFQTPSFPAAALIASGGHTDLLLMKSHGRFKWLGGTRDDAAGEAFDKIARLLGLPYPGGPAIARLAAKRAAKAAELGIKNQELRIKLPRPLLDEDNFDFSFSGLKTAVLREVNKLKTIRLRRAAGIASGDARQGFGGQVKQLDSKIISYFAFEVQKAITDVLVAKTIRAAQKYQVKSILLGGGVTANERLREKMSMKIENLSRRQAGLKLKIKLFVPPKSLCTDNAAVIASAAFFNYKTIPWNKVTADPGLHF